MHLRARRIRSRPEGLEAAQQDRLRELEGAIAAANRRIDELSADVTVLTGLLTSVLRLSARDATRQDTGIR